MRLFKERIPHSTGCTSFGCSEWIFYCGGLVFIALVLLILLVLAFVFLLFVSPRVFVTLVIFLPVLTFELNLGLTQKIFKFCG